MMRIRKIAILIDGAFFLKRLPQLVEPQYRSNPQSVGETIRILCKRHVQKLIGENEGIQNSKWLDHVYRLFYYDAAPYTGAAHNPISNQQIQFAKTENAEFREQLFAELRKKRKFALRLGKVNKEDGWCFKNASLTKSVLKTLQFKDYFLQLSESMKGNSPEPVLDTAQQKEFHKFVEFWNHLQSTDIKLFLRQKGVDMRIGVDIASITLKKQADTIILVTGDSDFVPAAKVARREGVEFLLDPLWQKINDDLHEHVDGIQSGLQRTDPLPNSPVTESAP